VTVQSTGTRIRHPPACRILPKGTELPMIVETETANLNPFPILYNRGADRQEAYADVLLMNFNEAEFMQYRSPVGRGPSSNT